MSMTRVSEVIRNIISQSFQERKQDKHMLTSATVESLTVRPTYSLSTRREVVLESWVFSYPPNLPKEGSLRLPENR